MRIYLRDIAIITVLMFIDIFSYYYWGKYVNLLFKPLFATYLAWWYYSHARKPIGRKSKLVILSLAVMLTGEFLFVFKENRMVNVMIILVFLIEHQIYISIFREENARLDKLLNKKKIIIFLPIILSCFIFFGYQMMPNIPDNFLLMGIVYCVQLSLMAGLSVGREVNHKSYILVIIAMILLILSDAFTSFSIFVMPFQLEYLTIRILFPLSKALFVLGMYHTLEINHSDKVYT